MKNSWYSDEIRKEVYSKLLETFPVEFMYEFPTEKGIDREFIRSEIDDKSLTLVIALLQELGADIC